MEPDDETTETAAPKTTTFAEAVMGIADLISTVKKTYKLTETTAMDILKMTMVYQQFPEESVSPIIADEEDGQVMGTVHEILTGEANADSTDDGS